MAYQSRVKERNGSLAVGIGVGITGAMILTLLLCAISAMLIGSERIPETAVAAAAGVTAALCAGAGGIAASVIAKKQRLLTCLLTGVGYLLALLSLTALFFGGRYAGVGTVALAVASGTAGAVLIGIRPEKRKNQRKWKRAYR